jgi:hypothetical protein
LKNKKLISQLYHISRQHGFFIGMSSVKVKEDNKNYFRLDIPKGFYVAKGSKKQYNDNRIDDFNKRSNNKLFKSSKKYLKNKLKNLNLHQNN